MHAPGVQATGWQRCNSSRNCCPSLHSASGLLSASGKRSRLSFRITSSTTFRRVAVAVSCRCSLTTAVACDSGKQLPAACSSQSSSNLKRHSMLIQQRQATFMQFTLRGSVVAGATGNPDSQQAAEDDTAQKLEPTATAVEPASAHAPAHLQQSGTATAAVAAEPSTSKADAPADTTSSGSSSSSSSQEWEDAWEGEDGQWEDEVENEHENDSEDEGEVEDEQESCDDKEQYIKGVLGKLKMFEPEWRQKKQEELAGMMSDQAYESAYEDLGAAMLAAGFKGSIALGVASLLSIDILSNFRWNAADLQTGVLWALPAAAVAGLLTIFPLPGTGLTPAAATAGSSSTSGSSSSSKQADDDYGYNEGVDQAAYDDVRRMARSSMVSQRTPITVNVPLKRLAEGSIEPSGAAAAIPMMTQPSFGAALRGLQHAREALLQPWSTDVTPPKARVLRVVEAQLGRLTSEVVWRGLVTTCLAGIIASSWATAGTSQDSPFFYARLFGLLTPQCSLAAAVGLLLLGRLPLLYLSGRPISLYTRLSSLDVQIVGQLTDDDWLVKVLPAAAAAGSSSSGSSRSKSSKKSSKLDSSSSDSVDAVFGRLRQEQEEDGGSTTSSSSSSSSSSGGSIRWKDVTSQDELEQQLQGLLASAALFCSQMPGSSSSSSISSSSSAAAVLAPNKEAEGAELLAQLLEVVRTTASLKAAAGKSSSSSSSSSGGWQRKQQRASATKVASALQQLMVRLNSSASCRYFIVHKSDDAASDDEDDGSESDDSDSDSDSDSSYELNSRSAAKRRAAVAKLTGSSSSSSSSGVDSKKSGAQMMAEALRNKPPKSLEDLSEKEMMALMQMLEEKLSEGSKHSQVMAEGWWAAGNVPTAEDRLVRALLLGYTVLTELAPAGAFVATGGNVAASFVASSCYNILALSMNDVAAQQARSAVRKALGKEWLMKLLPLQGKS